MSKLFKKVLGKSPKANVKKSDNAPENPVPAKKNAVPAAQTKEAVKAAKKAEQARHKAAVRQGNLISRTVLDVYPVRDCRKIRTGMCLVQEDGTLMDILWIRGKSYLSSSDDEIRGMFSRGMQFERLYKAPYKIVSLNMPTNTKEHRQYLAYMRDRQTSEVNKQLLSEQIEQYKRLDDSTTERQSFFFLYAKDERQMEQLKALIDTSPINVQEISYARKLDLLWRMNNMCKAVKTVREAEGA